MVGPASGTREGERARCRSLAEREAEGPGSRRMRARGQHFRFRKGEATVPPLRLAERDPSGLAVGWPRVISLQALDVAFRGHREPATGAQRSRSSLPEAATWVDGLRKAGLTHTSPITLGSRVRASPGA